MLSVIGLSFDLVGAAVLAIGLFRHSTPLHPGIARRPDEAATDQAFGITGFALLATGFGVQALPSLGVSWSGTSCEAAIAGVCALALGMLVGWLMYGAAFLVRFPMERQLLIDHGTPWPDSDGGRVSASGISSG